MWFFMITAGYDLFLEQNKWISSNFVNIGLDVVHKVRKARDRMVGYGLVWKKSFFIYLQHWLSAI